MKRTVTAAGILLVSFLCSPVAEAGVYYEATLEAVFPGQPGGPRMEFRGWKEGPNAKLEITEGDEQTMDEGMWLVTRDDGDTVTRVDTQSGTYSTLNLAELRGGIKNVLEALGGQAGISFEDPTMEKLSEEEGSTILGYETTHSVYVSSYVIVIEAGGTTQKTKINNRQELWTTDEIDESSGVLWSAAGPSGMGIPGLDDLIDKQMSNADRGFVLKSVTESTTAVQGYESATTLTTEVTKIEERAIPETVFTIPDDYKELGTPHIGGKSFSRQKEPREAEPGS